MSTRRHDSARPTGTARTARAAEAFPEAPGTFGTAATAAPSAPSAPSAGRSTAPGRPTILELLCAAVIDLVILIAPPVALHLLAGWNALAWISALELLATVIIVLACTGRTPGTAIVGARVVTAEGATTPGLGRATARVALTLLTPISRNGEEAGLVDGVTRCRTLTTRRSRRTGANTRESDLSSPRRRDDADSARSRAHKARKGGRAEPPAPRPLTASPASPSGPRPASLTAGETMPSEPVESAAPVVEPASASPHSPDPELPVRPTPAVREGILGPAANRSWAPSSEAGASGPRAPQPPAPPGTAPGTANAPVRGPGHTASPFPPLSGPVDSAPQRRKAPGAQESPTPPLAPPPPAAPAPPVSPAPAGSTSPGSPALPVSPTSAFESPASPPSAGRRALAGGSDANAASPQAPTRSRRRRATSHRAPASPSPAIATSPMSPPETPPPTPTAAEAPTGAYAIGRAGAAGTTGAKGAATRATAGAGSSSPSLAGGPGDSSSLGSPGTAAFGTTAQNPRGTQATQRQTSLRAVPQDGQQLSSQTIHPDVVLVTGSGKRVPLEGQCIIGRAPQPAFPDDTQLMTLETSSSALSRSHLRIGFDDRQLWAEDLSSANGTVMVHPTGQQIRLEPERRTAIAPGAVLLLANESITVEKSA